MKNEETSFKMQVKEKGERSNYDFHLRLSKSEKERLIMLTSSAGYATMSQFLKDQIFKPDIHHKLDMILKNILEMKDGKKGGKVSHGYS